MKWFSDRKNSEQIELGQELAPRFDSQGLIPCITVDVASGDILMFAWMNEDALEKTLESGIVTYYSRSRKKLWVKGEVSGRRQYLQQMLVDCDQDVLQLKVRVEGEGACHRGYRTCFYREVSLEEPGKLVFTEDGPVFDPEKIYS